MSVAQIISYIVLIIFFIQCPVLVNALEVISQRLNRTDITVGERVIYTISVRLKENEPISTSYNYKPEYLEFSSPQINTIDKPNQNQIIKEIIYQLVPFKPGENEIPSIFISSAEKTIKSKIMRFEVRTVLPRNVNDIKDIKKTLNMPVNWLAYIALTVFVLITSSSLLYLIKKYPRKKESVKQEILTLPHETAYEKFNQLEQMDLISKGLMKEYYSRVSHIVRTYIEDRYNTKVLESTSYDLMQNPQIKKLSELEKNMLHEILESSDMVKFAKYNPNKKEAKEIIEKAKEFVDKTREEKIL